MKTVAKSMRESLNEQLFYMGKSLIEIKIDNITNSWSKFMGERDRIKLLSSIGDNVSLYLYKAPKGFKFPPHTCKGRTESIIFLDGFASCDYLEDGMLNNIKLKTGDTMSFSTDVPHKYYFEEDSYMVLCYFPAFDHHQWSAESVDVL